MVDFTFTEQQLSLQKLARDFALKEIRPVAIAMDKIADPQEVHDNFPWEIIRKGSALGLRTTALPEKYGGAGIGILTHLIMLEELCQGDSAFATHFHQAWKMAKLLVQKCSDAQREHFLPKFTEDDTALLAVGITEPNHGCDNLLPYDEPDGGMQSTAVRDGDSWVLNGTKHFIACASVAKLYFIAMRTDKTVGVTQGITVFLVERGTPGFRTGRVHDKMGNRLMMNAELIFENCRIPDFNRVSEVGKGLSFLGSFGARHVPTTGAFGLALARAAFEYAVEYAKNRIQGGRPIIEHPIIALRFGEMAALIEAARAVSIRAAWSADQPDYDSQLGILSSIFSSDVGPKVCDMAIQILGGNGYMRDYPLEKLMRDAMMCYHIDGSSDLHRMKIGDFLRGVSKPGYIQE
ncbi:MAG: acyl-CoA/acyl-ACP dehydrogenase [bacterium]|nr:acyl-CoA/acyl-ACP dehydrogenase [bacterium]